MNKIQPVVNWLNLISNVPRFLIGGLRNRTINDATALIHQGQRNGGCRQQNQTQDQIVAIAQANWLGLYPTNRFICHISCLCILYHLISFQTVIRIWIHSTMSTSFGNNQLQPYCPLNCSIHLATLSAEQMHGWTVEQIHSPDFIQLIPVMVAVSFPL